MIYINEKECDNKTIQIQTNTFQFIHIKLDSMSFLSSNFFTGSAETSNSIHSTLVMKVWEASHIKTNFFQLLNIMSVSVGMGWSSWVQLRLAEWAQFQPAFLDCVDAVLHHVMLVLHDRVATEHALGEVKAYLACYPALSTAWWCSASYLSPAPAWCGCSLLSD